MITAEAEEGKIYDGTVTGVKDFGAFVEILPGKDGLLHISEIAHHRIEKVEDVMAVGDKLKVKVIDVSNDGKVRLSKKVLEEGGPPPGERSERSERPRRDRRPQRSPKR